MSRMGLGRQRQAQRPRKRGRGNGSYAGDHADSGPAPGAGDGDVSKSPKFNPWKTLKESETNRVLKGGDLTDAARALTALEIRPQLSGYKLLAKQLERSRDAEAKSIGDLGMRLTGEVGDVYRNIAESEAGALARQQALAGQLNSASSQIATQGAQQLQQMQQAQVGDVNAGLAMRGAPGGGAAQAELANVVAGQQASQNANAQASQQFAAQQGAGYGQLHAAMAGATQMQGGATAGGISRDVLSRVGESNRKYGEGIQTARAKLADVKALKGSTMVKNLLDLRSGEQKFSLGKQAVQGEKADRAAAAAQAKSDAEQQQFENNLALKQFGLDKWKAHHPNAGENEVKEKKQEIRGEVKEVKSLLGAVVGAEGAPKSKRQLNSLILALNGKASADPDLVRKVALHWWTERTQGNRGNKNATKTPYAP